MMASVFWDKQGIIHLDFLPHGVIINSEYYCHVLSDVHNSLRKKRPGFITLGVVFLKDNAQPDTTQRTFQTIRELCWEILPFLKSSDLASSHFPCLGP
ncbi:hypothetical protein TNIN_302511 [Trichonephila inaurata madagascariensis]|uniref:Uncharacterized protein n=1 Tax=Trichonephila inaurata madagascariensis TaxID=2747483 RepID=A0A8X6IBM9_9ARAC|nr:hypothetical protein TNIN_302511 [Trichonephila inaurata madagascariensis]